MRGNLVVGNWKMNGGLRQNDALLAALRAGWPGKPEFSAQGPANSVPASSVARIAVCVPYPYLWQAQAALSGSSIAWGAQDVSEYASGAYTGEVSTAMLVEFGCVYAIVGHSERRALYGDTDAIVAAKASAALKAGLTPIVCVGETLVEREADVTERVVLRQLDAVLALLGDGIAAAVVAYEPVWAIGTGRTATPDQAEEVHKLLRRRLRELDPRVAEVVPLLYGGSVKADNAKALFAQQNIDGGLVGGASLKADEFLAIAAA